jgi:hypothetical protein
LGCIRILERIGEPRFVRVIVGEQFRQGTVGQRKVEQLWIVGIDLFHVEHTVRIPEPGYDQSGTTQIKNEIPHSNP